MDQVYVHSELFVEIPDHQVLLSFNNDCDALQFQLWWDQYGFKSFSKWFDKRNQEASADDYSGDSREEIDKGFASDGAVDRPVPELRTPRRLLSNGFLV